MFYDSVSNCLNHENICHFGNQSLKKEIIARIKS